MPTGAKVLIADDDPLIVKALAARCATMGLEVQTAQNGLQAILRASRNPPRLLILDLQMPEADGFRVCEWLLDAKRQMVDVIILTARDDLATLERCDSFGAFHVVKGSDTWDVLQAMLREIFLLDEPASGAFASADADPAAELPQDNSRNKILIVEDDADLAESLARRFRKCGAVTFVAPDGISGFRVALQERPDLIITDYLMPGGSGDYLIWRLKSTRSLKRIPVIVITGQRRDAKRSAPPEHDTMGHGGPVRYFHKPLNLDALHREVSQHCNIHYAPFDTGQLSHTERARSF